MGEKLNYIINKLKNARNLESRLLLLFGLANSLSLAFIFLLVFSLIEAIAHGDSAFRTILFAFLILFSITGFIYLSGPYLLRILGLKFLPTLDDIALRVGREYPEIKDRLSNSIQLLTDKISLNSVSQELAVANFNRVFDNSQSKDFNKIVKKERLKKSFLLMFLVSFIFVAAVSLSTSIADGLNRIVNFDKEFIPPAPFELDIHPKLQKVTKGSELIITITSQGVFPEFVVLNYKEQGQSNYEKINLIADSNGSYTYKITAIRNTMFFYASAAWLNTEVKTDEATILVLEKPIVKSFEGTLNYPPYTNLGSIRLNHENGDITALKGSVFNFSISTNKNIDKASLVFIQQLISNENDYEIKSDTTCIKLNTNGTIATGSMRITSNGYYYFQVTDTEGLTNEAPIKYAIAATNDEYPGIVLEHPLYDVQVSEDAILPILVSVSDDYGFTALKLKYKLISSRYTDADENYSTVDIPFTKGQLSMQVPYFWELNKINISPEDIYEFYLEVYDNDIISGPKSARTTTLLVRLPSLNEVLESVDDMQKQIDEEVKELLKKAEEVKKDYEDLNRELMKKQPNSQIDWKEKKKAEDILKKQDELNSKINDLQKNISEMTQKLEDNKAISPETLEKYKELQKLLSEVSSPELKKLQEQMEQALKNINPEELQNAMKNTKFDEEQFRQSIERTMKILKRLQAEQKADAIEKRAEELLKKQNELIKKTENSNPNNKSNNEEMAKEQEILKEDLDNLAKDLDELQKLMEEIGENMPMQQMENAKNELNKDETSSEMKKAQNQLNQSELNKAKQSQQKAAKNLSSFSDAMKQLKEQMQNSISKEAIAKMQKALNDVLQLSKQQEALKEQTKKTDYSSLNIPDMSAKQSQLSDGLKNVINSMIALSEKSFAVTPEMGAQLGQALNKMQSAIQNLSNRSLGNSANNQTEAMGSLNKAASQMQAMLSSMNSSQGSCNNPGGEGQGEGSGMSFSQKLRDAAQQQQAINQSMQQMMGQQMNQGSLTQQQQAELGRIAREQGNAQKAIQELAKEQKEFAGQKKALGDLERIAKEMQEVVSDLQSGSITPETLNKQERILSRLLDASVSMNERDFEKKRESQTGTQYKRPSPLPIDLTTQEGKSKIIMEQQKALQQGYSKDYELLIRKYFDALQSKGQR